MALLSSEASALSVFPLGNIKGPQFSFIGIFSFSKSLFYVESQPPVTTMAPVESYTHGFGAANASLEQRRYCAYDKEKWEQMKDIIKTYYIDENCALKTLMAKLEADFDFRPR
jgi:hypothetical protein